MIEDNCESLGACPNTDNVHKSRLCGTFGLMNSFSFFHSHQISAIEGGMILTDDAECAKVCRMLRAHGWTRDIEKANSFDKEYDFRIFGYNVRPLEMHAAIAREQLKKLPKFIEARRNNQMAFFKLTEHLPIDYQMMWRESYAAPFGFCFTVESNAKRAQLARYLRQEGIDCRLPTGGSFTQHDYGSDWRDQKTPNADLIHRTGMFLGCAPYDMNADKLERIAGTIERGLK
jgi:CDP-6-deoxy-D-xylo-4-hexulose-3-dehydrase